MVHKLLDLYPKLSFLPEDDLDFSNFTSVAIPVSPGEKPQINKNGITLKSILLGEKIGRAHV